MWYTYSDSGYQARVVNRIRLREMARRKSGFFNALGLAPREYVYNEKVVEQGIDTMARTRVPRSKTRKLVLPVWCFERSRRRASKGARWMPWHQEPKKDVVGCEKPRGAASRLRAVDVRMGQPARGHTRAPPAECIGGVEVSRRIETSQYPEERKATRLRK